MQTLASRDGPLDKGGGRLERSTLRPLVAPFLYNWTGVGVLPFLGGNRRSSPCGLEFPVDHIHPVRRQDRVELSNDKQQNSGPLE